MHFSVITDARWTLEADRHTSRVNTSMDCAASQKKPLSPLGDLEIVTHQGNIGFQYFFLSLSVQLLMTFDETTLLALCATLNKILSIWVLISVGNSTLYVAFIFPL